MERRGNASRSGALANAGRAAIQAFVGSMLVLLPGVLAAPNLNEAFGLGVAALIASVVAVIRAVQEFVPQLTTGQFLSPAVAAVVDAALRAFVGAALVLLPGVLNAPDLATAKGLVTALVVAAFTAAIRALEAALPVSDPAA